MRYIYVVAGLILIIAGISGMTLLKPGPLLSKEAARVNKRVITIDEFGKAYEEKAATCPVPPDKKQFLEDLVTREILIQEAKRLGLDREEPFRRSIQNYYEQALLKNLTQKKMSDITVSVSEEEIASYYSSMGNVYELSVLVLPSEHKANEAIKDFPSGKADKRTLHVDEIPHEMLDAVLTLKVGEVSLRPVPCDKGFFVFRLEGYRKEPVPPLDAVRDEIRKTIGEKKRQTGMERWLAGLKKDSRITINDSLLK
jgi:hypothetical protein